MVSIANTTTPTIATTRRTTYYSTPIDLRHIFVHAALDMPHVSNADPVLHLDTDYKTRPPATNGAEWRVAGDYTRLLAPAC